MQGKIAESSHFFRRTDILAETLRVNRDDLPAIIGISKRMFYGYRKGTYPISSKAWGKLEDAERAAGIAIRAEANPILSGMAVEEQPSDSYLKALFREDDARNPTVHYAKVKRFLREFARMQFPDNDETAGDAYGEMVAELRLAMDESVYRAALQHLQGHGNLRRITGMEELEEEDEPPANNGNAKTA